MSRANQNLYFTIDRPPASSVGEDSARTRGVAGLSAVEADMFIWLTGAGKRAGR